MATVRRSITIDAGPARVWEVLQDPHHMPRWWPGVTRMEAVEPDRFTQVFVTKNGKPVRVDFNVLESEPPDEAGTARRAWEQEVIGTPFERVLSESITEVQIAPAGAARTVVTLTLDQKLRGYSRFGGFMLKRATVGRLDEALANLESIF
jgi:uncharacterized protein YndB with AHSA1/START domain